MTVAIVAPLSCPPLACPSPSSTASCEAQHVPLQPVCACSKLTGSSSAAEAADQKQMLQVGVCIVAEGSVMPANIPHLFLLFRRRAQPMCFLLCAVLQSGDSECAAVHVCWGGGQVGLDIPEVCVERLWGQRVHCRPWLPKPFLQVTDTVRKQGTRQLASMCHVRSPFFFL